MQKIKITVSDEVNIVGLMRTLTISLKELGIKAKLSFELDVEPDEEEPMFTEEMVNKQIKSKPKPKNVTPDKVDEIPTLGEIASEMGAHPENLKTMTIAELGEIDERAPQLEEGGGYHGSDGMVSPSEKKGRVIFDNTKD